MCFDPQRSFIKHVVLVDILNKINFAVGTRISLHKISTARPNTSKHFVLITLSSICSQYIQFANWILFKQTIIFLKFIAFKHTLQTS